MRKQTKRKIYRTNVCAVTTALVGALITDEESLNKLRKVEQSSLEAFKSGTATIRDWNNISAVVSLSESMAAANIGPEVMVHAKIAEMHLLDANDRYKKLGKLGSTGLGLSSFKEILEWHDLQRSSVARSVYEAHIKKVTNMVKSKSPKIKFL